MNRIYRLVFNPSLGQVQVAAEFARGPRRCVPGRSRAALWLAPLTAALLLTGSLQATAQTLPQNGTITSGSGIINVNGNTMTVTQQSQAALFQWSSFSIGSGNTVRFDQAGSRSTAINLVTGPSASIISGQLLSNGQVFLLNPAGITFTGTASVNVGGLLASTLMPGAQGIPLDGGVLPPSFELGGTGTNAAVSNLGGTLTATAGGISLVGGSVFNNGYIAAPLGNIDLAAASAVTAVTGVSSAGMPSLAFVTTAASGMAGTGISNVGTLSARNISMTALMGPGLSSTGINAGGTIIANAIDGADGSLTIRSSAPVAINDAIITANAMSTVGSAVMGGPVAIQMTGGSIDATTVNLNGGINGDVVLSGSIKADSIGIDANNITQTAGSLEGALQLDTQGRVTLGQASNAINRVGGHVGTDLTLATSTSLANSGALSVGGNTTLDAATGNITLTHAGNSFGNRVSAKGADVSLVGIGALNLGDIDARSLDVQGGSLGLSGTITTSGDQAYRSAVTLQGNSTLQGGTIRFDGTVDGSYYLGVAASGVTTFLGAIGGSTALQGLNVATGSGARLSGDVTTLGMLAFTGPLQVYGSRRLTSLGGNMTLGGAVDGDGGDLSLSARQLTLAGAVGATGPVDRLYASADTITLGSRIASRREMLLQGDIRLDGNTQLVSTNDGVITTDGISSNIGSGYNLTISTGNRIQVNGNISAADVDISGLIFSGRGIVSKGNLGIDSRLNLLQTGSYQVDGLSRFSSQGDITLTDAGNRFSGEVALQGGNAELRAGDLLLGSTSLQGSLGLHLTGGLQQASGSALNIGGTTRIDAGGPINLDRANGLGQPVNRFGGEVSLKGRGSYISAAGTLAFSDFDVDSLLATADVVQLPASGRSIGLQYFQGNVVLTRDSVLDSQLGQINFRGRIDGGYALTLARGLNVVFADDVGGNQALASLDISGAGPLQLGGNITADGAIRLGNVNLVSNTPRLFSVRSNNGNLLAGRIDGSSDGRSSLALNAHGALELQSGAGTTPGAGLANLELKGASVIAQAIRTSGRLDVSSTTGFTQGGTLTVGGDASFSAGSSGNLMLDTTANTFAGKVALSGNQVRIRAQPGLALDGVTAAALDAGSAGALSLANANVAGTAVLDGTSLLFDQVSIGGALLATASAGDIRQGSGSLAIGNNSQLTASTDIVLGGTGNQLGSALQVQGRDIALSSSTALDVQQLQAARDAVLAGNGVRLGTTSVQGTLQVNSTGAITQSAALQVAGNSRFQAGSDITLDQAGNRFDGSVGLDGGNVAVTTSGGLLLDRVSASGNLDARAGSAGVSQQAAVQVGGRSDIRTQGAIALDRADNRFTGAVGLDGKGVDLRTAGDLQIDRLNNAGQSDVRLHAGGGLQLPTSAIDAGTGNLTLLADGGVLQANALLAGNNVTLTGRDGVRLGGDLRSGGSLTLSSSNADIVQIAAPNGVGGSVQAAGAVQVNAGNGRIALGNAGNRFGGVLNLSGGDINVAADTLLLGSVNAGGTLSLASAGDIRQQGAVQVVGATHLSAGGDIDLQAAGNRFGDAVAVQGRQVALASTDPLQLQGVTADSLIARSGGHLSLGAAGIAGNAMIEGASLLLDGATIGGTLLATAHAGAIRQGSGSLAIGNNSQLTASTDIVLGGTGNQLGSALQVQGRDIALSSSTALDIQQLQAARDVVLAGNGVRLGATSVQGTLQVNSTGAITQSAALQVAGNSRLQAGSDITLDQAGNRFDGSVGLDGGNVAVTTSGGLLLDRVSASGNLDARAGSAGVSQQAAVQVGGRSDIRTQGAIALDRADNRFTGAVGLDGKGVDLRAAGDLQIDRLNNAGQSDIRLHAGGGLQLPTSAIDAGTGNLALLADGGVLQANALLAGNNVTLTGRDGVRLGGDLRSGGSLTLSSSNADIVQIAAPNGVGGSVQAAGVVQVNAGSGRIALGNAGNRFGGALNLSGGDINVAADTLLLGSVNAGGTLSLASAGDMRQQGAVQVAGTTRLSAGGDIDLQAAGNRFGDAVAVQGQQVALASDGALQLQGVTAGSLVARSAERLTLSAADVAGNVTLQGQQLHFGTTQVGGNLQATGSNGIDQDGTLRVDGSTDLRSDASIALGSAGNELRGVVSLAGVGIDLASAGDLRIGSLDNRSAAVRLQAGGSLNLPTGVIDTGGGDLQLLAGGALQLPVALRGNNITLRSGQDLQLGQDVLAAGELQLGSGGALTQSGGVLAAQRLQGSAGGKASLRGDNRIATLGDFSSQGLELRTTQGLQVAGNVQAGAQGLLDVHGGDLQLNGSVQAGQLRLQSSGAIRAGAGGRLLADQLSGRAAGPTMLGDASQFVANAIGTLGDFQSPAGFSLTNAGTLALASLNGSAFSVDAGNSGFYLKVQGGDIRQLGTTPVLAGASHWWSSGSIGTQPLPIYLTSAGSSHVVDFIGRPPAYFYGIGTDGLPLVVGGGLNLPTAIVGARTQGSVLPRVAYVDMGALSAQYRAFGIVQPGIRLPADQTVACDSGDPDAECAQ
ncbi:filamentous hemagglutinin N-terminal domain-containing protein [Stenotrophomonas maltophilia]|uniref:Filamentous hemagglutinin N-terminal domain-containing protein n=2 Tax=Gammaproteobacteria TaxID=1236 RepID=A0ABT2XJ09_9GAMM|nr:filamentous hemagglutinin N-terminal domain-containing protein [Stenotrophomonas sp. CFS3442]MBH1619113.1 filamentous hemagglutinin N-terminal domain-containing protein [Stenotrophomonas maltophilia]MCV0325927.1 filamentous hemagglutinin N-terminal domain-containing protein [Stenotrophomonas sp. CFS3442]